LFSLFLLAHAKHSTPVNEPAIQRQKRNPLFGGLGFFNAALGRRILAIRQQPFAAALDVVAVQQPLSPVWHERAEPELTFDQWQVPHVLAIEPEQVEGVEPRLVTPE
jgi:hypothetical protein